MSAADSSNNEWLELKYCKRRVELYLRALWGSGFNLRCTELENTALDNAVAASYIHNKSIHLPEQISFLTTSQMTFKQYLPQYYRAAATHAALHVVYGEEPFQRASHNLLQRSMIGLVEDLRLELRAIEEFPGLRQLWIAFHLRLQLQTDNAQNLMARLSRSVLDPAYQDAHLWVHKGKALILENKCNLKKSAFSLETGLRLANDLGQMRLPLNSGRYEQLIAYRDDNRCLWQEPIDIQQHNDTVKNVEDLILQHKHLKEERRGIEMEITNNDKHAGEGFYIKQQEQADFEYLQHRAEDVTLRQTYPEWDYRTHVLKKDWCTVTQLKCKKGSIGEVMDILERHKGTLLRLRHIAKRLQTEKRQRIRKLEEGDEVDLDPLINAMVAIRLKLTPDTRVFMQNTNRRYKDMAILILLDLSESTNETVIGTNTAMSQLMRDAVLLLGETLSIAEEQFAITGFSSNGRHQINMTNFKEFSESFVESKARLSEIRGKHSTRLGPAIRHSALSLAQQLQQKKLLLVITDGAPSDIDVYDKHYLKNDSWHAIRALKKSGIKAFCLNLDSGATQVIEHIFGSGHFETLENLTRLPEVLSRLYIKHARH